MIRKGVILVFAAALAASVALADWTCPNCRTSNSDQFAVCSRCGAKVVWKCPACKTDNPINNGFCGKCGAKCPSRPAGSPEVPPATKPELPPSQPPPNVESPNGREASGSSWGAWKPIRGKWEIRGNSYLQTSGEKDCRSFAPPAAWTDYDFEVRARKTGGAEGFLIIFRARDPDHFYWWNLGGLGNKKHAVEKKEGGQTQTLQSKNGTIEANRWYQIRTVLRGPSIKCYLDGKLVHDLKNADIPSGGVGLASWGTAVEYADLRVTASDGKPLLTGSVSSAQISGLPLPPAAPPPTLESRVDKAIDLAIKFIWSQQKPDGSWPGYNPIVDKNTKAVTGYKYPVGPTALAAYALLEAGVSPQDPRMAKTLDWLAKTPCSKTYSLGLRASAWEIANRSTQHKYRPQLEADARLLLESCSDGHYHYDCKGRESSQIKDFDNSNSQYGVLGVWAAAREDAEIPVKYWEMVMRHWVKYQGENGGWGYKDPTGRDKAGNVTDATRATMTAAGLASLYVCVDNLAASRYIACRGNTDEDVKPIKAGLEWMDKRFADSIERPGGYWHYYLYCMERVGLACGYKYFGGKDWYRFAADKLLPQQKGDGRWGDGLVDTSFSLLFLVRGRHPVLFNKLEYSGDWNNRPRDLANLTRWISSTFEGTVNWQIVNLRSPVEEWHDAPLLYIAGSREPTFSAADLDKLRTFVQQGGTIFSAAECGGTAFSKGIRQAYAQMFPQYELVPLGKDHEIYSAHFPLRGTPALHLLSNGVRPLAIHTDVDLPKSWQLRNAATQKWAFQAPANLFLYLTAGGQLRNRGAVHWPKPPGAPAQLTVRLARLKHNGNCDPEPLACERLRLLMAERAGTKVEVVGPLDIAALPQAGAAVAVMTGTGEFKLADAEVEVLKQFIAAGGTIIIDAAGGARLSTDAATQIQKPSEFAASAEALLAKLSPASSLSRLSSQADVLRLPHYVIENVKYRPETRKRLAGQKEPNFRVVLSGDRPAVFYSREDLTAALVGSAASSLDGYEPESAFELLRNIILYAAVRGSAAANKKSR